MIDYRTLTIGAHILMGGNMVRVAGIDLCSVTEGGSYERESWTIRTEGTGHGDLEPIPITEDLLKEFGFSFRNAAQFWARHYGRKMFVAFSEYPDGFWLLDISPKHSPLCSHFFVRWLHEAEAFLWITYGLELIKD